MLTFNLRIVGEGNLLQGFGGVPAPLRRTTFGQVSKIKGPIPDEFQPTLAASGNRDYGCDICHNECPFCIKRPRPTTEPAFQPRTAATGRKLTDLTLMTEEEFRTQFKGSPVKRAKRRGLLRSVAVALASSDDPKAERALEQASVHDPEPLVREPTKWALKQVRLLREDVAQSLPREDE